MAQVDKKIINLINKKIREKSKEEIQVKKEIKKKRKSFLNFGNMTKLIFLDVEKRELIKLKEEIKQIK